MAIQNFRPEIWAANILVALRKRYVYGQPGIINREYEGLIARAGDTVHITSVVRPTIRDYTEHGTITWEQLADEDRALVVDQADYFAFKVDDIERRQSLPGFVAAATAEAGVGLAEETDAYLSDLMWDALNGTDNDLGAVTVDISDNNAYGALFVALRGVLSGENVPMSDRFVIIPPEVVGALLQDARFIDASQSGDTSALRNGLVGRIAGFDVYESNTVPNPTAGTFHVIAGHPMATTFAEQINEVESMRLENMFGDGVRGLHLYGGKVVRPEALAGASVTVQA